MFFSPAGISARLTPPYFLILTTPPLPASYVRSPIQINFFHYFSWVRHSNCISPLPHFLCFLLSSFLLPLLARLLFAFPSHSSDSYSSNPRRLVLKFIWASQKGVKSQIHSPIFFILSCWEIRFIMARLQRAFFFFFNNFILPCHQAPTDTTVVCFGNRPTQISVWRMATGVRENFSSGPRRCLVFKFPQSCV